MTHERDIASLVKLGPKAEFRGYGVVVRNPNSHEIEVEITRSRTRRIVRKFKPRKIDPEYP